MKYTYVFLGHGRTGSTSLWRMLGRHPQISASIEKDYLRDHPFLHSYLKNCFRMNSKTQVLVDGSTDFRSVLFLLSKKISMMEEINRVCCIYVLRDPKAQIVSTFDLINKLQGKNILKIESIHNDDGSIDYETKTKQIAWYNINQYDYLKRIEKITGKDNILIMKLEEIEEKQGEIYKFLGIDDNKLKFPKINTSVSFNPNVQQLKDKLEMMKWADAFFKKTVQEISDEQIDLIHERYKVI